MKLKCQRCGWEWDYTGKKVKMNLPFYLFTSCPRCKTSVKISEASNEELKDYVLNGTNNQFSKEVKYMAPMRDGTGPQGKGPRTGRGRGNC